jgi:hypothetical protein
MPRKEDAHMDELEGVAQRLRDERPQASPLDLDRIKTTAMARAKSGAKGGRAGARRLAVAGLTVGLLVATTGGVLAGEGSHGKGKGSGSNGGGNAANAQYGGECNIQNGSGNVGDNNGQGSENNACNENTFINETNNITETNNSTNNVTNNYNSSTVTVAGPANSGVLAATTTKKATTSSKHVKIHINVPNKSKLRKVTLKVNGKIVSVLRGKKASKNVTLVSLPCSATVTITAVTASGKTVTQTHKYNLC